MGFFNELFAPPRPPSLPTPNSEDSVTDALGRERATRLALIRAAERQRRGGGVEGLMIDPGTGLSIGAPTAPSMPKPPDATGLRIG